MFATLARPLAAIALAVSMLSTVPAWSAGLFA